MIVSFWYENGLLETFSRVLRDASRLTLTALAILGDMYGRAWIAVVLIYPYEPYGGKQMKEMYRCP